MLITLRAERVNVFRFTCFNLSCIRNLVYHNLIFQIVDLNKISGSHEKTSSLRFGRLLSNFFLSFIGVANQNPIAYCKLPVASVCLAYNLL